MNIRAYIDIVEGVRKPRAVIPDVLYHGTSFRGLVHIIAKDEIFGSEDDNEAGGTFTSPDPEVSARYVGDVILSGPDGGIIALDAKKLIANGYKIKPYVYHSGTDGIEYVIDSLHRYIEPASTYVREITMTKANYRKIKAALRKDPDCVYNHYEWEGGPEEYYAAVQKALAFPFRLI